MLRRYFIDVYDVWQKL